MTDLLLQAAEGLLAPNRIGLTVMAIIAIPVIFLIITSIFSPPRTFRVPGLFLGSLILLIGAIIFAFAAFSAILGLIVPQ